MSLTSFLVLPDVRAKFSENFPLPQVLIREPLAAPPLTEYGGLVGTAFDYLLRFYLERLNTDPLTFPWIAEVALQLIPKETSHHQVCTQIIREAKRAHDGYISSGVIDDGLLESVLLLAQIDGIYRARYMDKNLGKTDLRDKEDLRKLIELVRPEMFKASKTCILNPDFGEGSELVDGADADFIIDDTLFEIKTTKTPSLRADYYHQLIGYYVLFQIGGIPQVEGLEIRKLAVYYARYGVIFPINVNSLRGATDFGTFVSWFKTRAKEAFPVGEP
jgi:hypothetical protein